MARILSPDCSYQFVHSNNPGSCVPSTVFPSDRERCHIAPSPFTHVGAICHDTFGTSPHDHQAAHPGTSPAAVKHLISSWQDKELLHWSPHCQNHCLEVSSAQLASISIECPEIQKSMNIPAPYQAFYKVFSTASAVGLPPHRPYDHIPAWQDISFVTP